MFFDFMQENWLWMAGMLGFIVSIVNNMKSDRKQRSAENGNIIDRLDNIDLKIGRIDSKVDSNERDRLGESIRNKYKLIEKNMFNNLDFEHMMKDHDKYKKLHGNGEIDEIIENAKEYRKNNLIKIG